MFLYPIKCEDLVVCFYFLKYLKCDNLLNDDGDLGMRENQTVHSKRVYDFRMCVCNSKNVMKKGI